MIPADLPDRVRAFLARLDARLERQTFQPGADAPHAVSLVGAFQRAAGGLELDLSNPRTSKATVFAMARVLRRMVDTHRIIVRNRGLYLRR